MKCIVLAKMSKRIIASIIDFLLIFTCGIVLFLTVVYPLSFDKEVYIANQKKIQQIYENSGVYVKTETNESIYYEFIFDLVGNSLTSPDDENAIAHLNTLTYMEKTYHPVNSVFEFYTNKENEFDDNGFGFFESVSTIAEIKETIFKVGTKESNIKSIDNSNGFYEISVIDEENTAQTYRFVADVFVSQQEGNYGIHKKIADCPKLIEYNDANKNMMWMSMVYIVPVLFGFAFIFYFIIPICSKNGQTIGKYITGLAVLSQDGYELKKIYYLPRFLSYFVVELCLGIFSFGGIFLISYMMFCFSKKRRCIHDYFSNSVVIDKKDSTWFKNREQEYLYNSKTRI